MNSKSILLYYVFFFSIIYSGTQISGLVIEENNEPVSYANVYIENSYDGASTDLDGKFTFISNEVGKQIIICSYVGYESFIDTLILNNIDIKLNIALKRKVSTANEVIVTAGTFEASDENRVVILNPIDIVSTAGARGDITGALQALPGSQPRGEEEGLFVRGGDASESKTIVDGLVIQNPYFSSVPDIPQRGRFTPFEFEGTVFSTGGYSAIYGQALSSIVDLTTWNRFGDVDAHTIGITPLSLSYGRPFGNEDITCGINLNYTNLKYYNDFNNSKTLNNFFRNRVSFIKPPEGFQINTNFKKKMNKGTLKYYGRYSANNLIFDIEEGSFNLENNNIYISSIYNGIIKDDVSMNIGFSYSSNEDDRFLVYNPANGEELNLDIASNDNLYQIRSVFSRKLFSNSILRYGIHLFDQYNEYSQFDSLYQKEEKIIDEFMMAGFFELDMKLSRTIAFRLGGRLESSKFLDKTNAAPRFSFAYKLGRFDQISYAYGKFYQTPDLGFDQWYRDVGAAYDTHNMNLDFESSTHHILNYQWVKNNRVFRVELYDKEYNNLIRIDDDLNLNNNGYGYAKGIDIFWRDNKFTFENIDFWLSYSYLNTKRQYRDYPRLITPAFAAEHILTLIFKQNFEISKSQFQLSLGYTLTSGRPYYDPFNDLEYTTENYQSFNIGGSIIPPIGENNFLVIFFNLENPFGYRNSFGYRYRDFDYITALDEPDEIRPPSLRTFFIGCFMFFDTGNNE